MITITYIYHLPEGIVSLLVMIAILVILACFVLYTSANVSEKKISISVSSEVEEDHHDEHWIGVYEVEEHHHEEEEEEEEEEEHEEEHEEDVFYTFQLARTEMNGQIASNIC